MSPDQVDANLVRAAEDGNAQNVLFWLQRGARIETRRRHRTPLQHAASYGHAQAVALLLDHGADVHAVDVTRHTALHLAAQWGDRKSVELLLDRGADIEARDSGRRTPLHLASGGQSPEALQCLLDRGADVHVLDDKQATPLHHATRRDNVPAMRALIERGASVDLPDDLGQTPLHIAAERTEIPAMLLLLAAGSTLGASIWTRTPPSWIMSIRVLQLDRSSAAAELGDWRLLDLALETDDPLTRSTRLSAALSQARQHGTPQTVAYLQSLQARDAIEDLSLPFHALRPL